MNRKQRRTYKTPPVNNYTEITMTVGTLNQSFATGDGPQRDRPKDKANYTLALRRRAKAYGTYSPAILTPRIVWDRDSSLPVDDSKRYWVLDGVGSNHWLEELYGPNFPVPVRLIANLTETQANEIFQGLQKSKHVTKNEKFMNDREYNTESIAFKIEQAAKKVGFSITSAVKDPWGIGATTAEFIQKRYGAPALTDTLQVVANVFPDDEWKRTNGALVKAVAQILGNQEYDRDLAIRALMRSTAVDLASGARGSGGESIVRPRIERLYAEVSGEDETK